MKKMLKQTLELLPEIISISELKFTSTVRCITVNSVYVYVGGRGGEVITMGLTSGYKY